MRQPPLRRGVTLDLRAAQRRGYRHRGVGRYSVELARALVAGHPDLIDAIRVDPNLPPAGGLGELVTSGLLTTQAWSTGPAPRGGGTYHVMAPFDLEARFGELWPRAASVAGARLVVTVYDLIPEVMPEVYLTDPGHRRRYRARRELARAADAVVTLSASAAADVVEHLGVAPSRVHVVGAACGSAFEPPLSPDAAKADARRAIAGLGPGWIVYNGAVEPRKNMERLVEAYARLPSGMRERWQLVLVCSLAPLERNHFEVRARRLGIEGRLVLTGFLPDEALAKLYQGADLVAFPSLYEGYGLPVAEALACGAAVVASGRSAMAELVAPEATFDPLDTSAITAALARALSDSALRGRLEAWAARPRPTWAEVADRVADVHRGLIDRSPTERAGWRRRPRVAMVTPWPPQRSGIGSYNARLVAALRGRVDVDVFVDGDDAGQAGPGGHQPGQAGPGGHQPGQAGAGGHQYGAVDLPDGSLAQAPAVLRLVAPVRGGYDAVILTLGNSEFHAGALSLLRTGDLRPIVAAHDVRLTGLYRHSEGRQAVPEGYAAALETMYPGIDRGVLQDGWVPPEMAERHGLLMAREAISRSGHFLTTSAYAAALARLDAAPGDAGRVGVWAYAYPPVVPRCLDDEDEDLVTSFGLVDPAKRPEALVAAMAHLVPGRPHARLAFVGPVATGERRRLESLAADLEVGDRVAFVGHTDEPAYRGWLRRAAVAVQLRARTNGETSGAIADCLAHGVATVVTDIGPQRELPESVTKVPADVEVPRLAAVVAGLLDDPPRRHRLGAAAQDWVGARGFDKAADTLVELLAAGTLVELLAAGHHEHGPSTAPT